MTDYHKTGSKLKKILPPTMKSTPTVIDSLLFLYSIIKYSINIKIGGLC